MNYTAGVVRTFPTCVLGDATTSKVYEGRRRVKLDVTSCSPMTFVETNGNASHAVLNYEVLFGLWFMLAAPCLP